MSDTKSTMNRREAMRMLGASFMGAVTLGGSTYLATDLYQREIAEADVDAAMSENPNGASTKEELVSISQKDRDYLSRSYGKVGAVLGALIGSEHYDWDMPDPFKPQID